MRVVRYLTDHAIASVVLVCSVLALAGSSYAAFSLPPGSVGHSRFAIMRSRHGS